MKGIIECKYNLSMSMLKILLLVVVIMGSLCCEAQKVAFAYDETGNRVKREIFVPTPSKVKGRSMHGGDSYYDMLGERTVKISQDTYGIIKVSISEFVDGDNCTVDVYTLNGLTIFSGSINEFVTIIDISGQPDGVYILKVIINGNQTTWKLNKN